MEDLVYRDVVRKYLDPRFEWLSKINTKEFHKWKVATCRFLGDLTTITEVEIDKYVLEEIKIKEVLYQNAKKGWQERVTKNKFLDKSIHNNLNKIHDLVTSPSNPNAVLKENGLTKHKGRDICLGGELTQNGRLYPKNYFTSKSSVRMDKYEAITETTNSSVWDDRSYKNLDWMSGEIGHPKNHIHYKTYSNILKGKNKWKPQLKKKNIYT